MAPDKRQLVLENLRGQTVIIPNLHPIFDKWSGPVNPNYTALVPVVHERLESLVPNQRKVAKLKTADFALFASHWWPKAGFAELRIVCFLAIWLFLWDDELDEPTGEHAHNFDTAQKYREETLSFVRNTLGLGDYLTRPKTIAQRIKGSFKAIGWQLKLTAQTCSNIFSSTKSQHISIQRVASGVSFIAQQLQDAFESCLSILAQEPDPPRASHVMIESFRIIGEALKKAYTIEQRQTFFQEIEFYIGTTVTEQEFKLTGKIPTLEEYWSMRMGTSAVAACLGVIEFAHGIRGPYRTTREPSLLKLCDEANIIVVIANDMLSLKKEIKVGSIDSLIPLWCVDDYNVQRAMDQAHTDLLLAVDRFESEANKILSGPSQTSMSDGDLKIFIDGCRECWVGNFNWSLCTGRYGMGAFDQKNGSFAVSL